MTVAAAAVLALVTVLATVPAAQPAAAAGSGEGLCAKGQRQSPIAIDIRTLRRTAAPPLRFEYAPARPVLRADGHTVRLRWPPGSTLWRGSERLRLQELHFHRPGGEQLQGEAFPASMHLLHRDAAGRLVALVVLLREGAEHPALAQLLGWLPAATAKAAGDVPRLDLRALLPADGGYYAYDGSLTDSPCTEGVRWLVLRQPVQASAAQLQALAARIPLNMRGVQPLNGRTVDESR